MFTLGYEYPAAKGFKVEPNKVDGDNFPFAVPLCWFQIVSERSSPSINVNHFILVYPKYRSVLYFLPSLASKSHLNSALIIGVSHWFLLRNPSAKLAPAVPAVPGLQEMVPHELPQLLRQQTSSLSAWSLEGPLGPWRSWRYFWPKIIKWWSGYKSKV